MDLDPSGNSTTRSGGQPGDYGTGSVGSVAMLESAFDAARRVALASVGAVSMASDTANRVFDEFVRRGEQTTDAASQRVKEVRERRSQTSTTMADFVRGRMDRFLGCVNLPSKGDMDSINTKLGVLSRKIDEVQASQTSGVPPLTEPGPDLHAGRDRESSG